MTDPHSIIAACTRAGVTSWQNVARQLGISVDTARARFDPGYDRAYFWAPSRAPLPEPVPEDVVVPLDDQHIPTNSPHAKGPGLKAEILCLLEHHGSLSVETIANLLHRPALSVRKRMNTLRAEGLVVGEGRFASGSVKTWRLVSVTRHGSEAKERA